MSEPPHVPGSLINFENLFPCLGYNPPKYDTTTTTSSVLGTETNGFEAELQKVISVSTTQRNLFGKKITI